MSTHVTLLLSSDDIRGIRARVPDGDGPIALELGLSTDLLLAIDSPARQTAVADAVLEAVVAWHAAVHKRAQQPKETGQ